MPPDDSGHPVPSFDFRVFDLELSGEGVSQVHGYMRRQRMGRPDAQRLLQRMQEERHAWVTFDSAISQEYPRLPFLHIRPRSYSRRSMSSPRVSGPSAT